MPLIILILFAVNMNAETATLFVESTSEFHKLDADILKKEKKSATCIHCHLLDDKNNPNVKWLYPQENIPGKIINIETDNGEPDSFSKACLMCHDGNEASLVLNAPLSPCGLKNLAPISPNGANHPVFMEYTDKESLHSHSSVLSGDWNDANQVSDLLRDEKVVCISCHLPHHSKERGYLRTSMRGSKLCMGCHDK